MTLLENGSLTSCSSAGSPGNYMESLAHPPMLNVLVVEPNPALSATLGRLLVHLRYRPTVLHSPQEALAQLKQRSFDLVLTDLALNSGQPTGLNLVRQIKQASASISSGPTHPGNVVLMGGMPLADYTPADGFLYKPFTLVELQEILAAFAPVQP